MSAPPRSSTINLKPPAMPMPGTGGSTEDVDASLADLFQIGLLQIGHDLVGVQTGRVPLGEFVEYHEHGAEVGTVRAQQHRLAGDRNDVRYSRCPARDPVQSRHDVAGSLHRGGIWQLHIDQQPALVLLVG